MVAFLSQVGSRLAIRAAAPLAAGVVGWLVLQNDPGAAVRGLARSLFGATAGAYSGVGPALVGLIMAGWAAPRVMRGLSGWLRHLPVSGRDLGRAALLALVIAQAPIVLVLLFLALVAGLVGPGFSLVSLLSVPVAMAAAGLVVGPAARRWVSLPLAGTALLLACSGSWTGLGVALVLVGVVDMVAGGLPARRARETRRRLARAAIPQRIALRALGPRVLVAYLAAGLPLIATLFFRANNTLDPGVAVGAVRLGGGLSMAILLAALAEPLAVRRPAWPWARSLPWSALARVRGDALMFAVAAVPLLALVALIEVKALLPLSGLTALLTARAAGAVRRAAERRTGAAGEVLAEGAFVAAWIALVPELALVAVVLVPPALRAASEREKAQRVSRWLELHHQAAGDSLSWSG
jgi:hypothetical protein